MDCVNLKREFGEEYHVQYEESYHSEYGSNARVEVPWLMIIPCRNGQICPWGGRNLVACTNRLGPVANKLIALPFTKVVQEGGDGANMSFDLEHFDEIARIMKPRRRRRLSPDERVRRVQRLHEYWAHKRQVRTPTEPNDAAA